MRRYGHDQLHDFYPFQVIFACNGIVCSSISRYSHRIGTLALKQYSTIGKTCIEWESCDGEAVWKTCVDDLKRIQVKRRRYMLLVYKFERWSLEYYFPGSNAHSFVRMLEVTHSVKYKWNPIPFVMRFTIVEKRNTFRRFADLNVPQIMCAKHARKEKLKSLNRNDMAADQSVVTKPSSTPCRPEVKIKNRGGTMRCFHYAKLVFTKIVNCPLVWLIAESMGRAAVKTAVQLIETHVVQSRFVRKIRGDGIGMKIFGVAVKLQISILSSLLKGAYSATKYLFNDECEKIQSMGARFLLQ